VKCKISHKKNEKKSEFENPWSGFLRFKKDTPIVLGPNREREEKKKREGKTKTKKSKTLNLQPCNTNTKLASTLQHIKQEKEDDEDKGSSPFLFTIIKV